MLESKVAGGHTEAMLGPPQTRQTAEYIDTNIYCTRYNYSGCQISNHAERTCRRSHPNSLPMSVLTFRHKEGTECSHPLTSVPFTLTIIFTGKGDMPCALVISGTAERPRSDDVCVSILWRLFVNVEDRSESNFCRSTGLYDVN